MRELDGRDDVEMQGTALRFSGGFMLSEVEA
jgi:hypothetical protein